MKKLFLLSILLVNVLSFGSFDDYFYPKTLRIDYYHCGSSNYENISLDKFYLIDHWAGSKFNLIDSSGLGKYIVEIYILPENELVYSYGFDSIFFEYQTTKEAKEGKVKTYSESVLIPYPKRDFEFIIKKRIKREYYEIIFKEKIAQENIMVSREKSKGEVHIWKKINCGEPTKCVDILILAEGYRKEEKKKAIRDFERTYEIFFSQEPYKTYIKKFNFYGIYVPSAESGCDEPSHNSWKDTPFGTSFDSLGTERYILSEDNKKIRDLASLVPYDSIVIMINHKRYGGGGIYNLFAIFTVDNYWSEYLLLHEFGHSFAGLGDEYYTSSTSYEDFYTPEEEPAEPNITALLEGEPLKWGDYVLKDTPIPTPWEKEKFEKLDEDYQKKRVTLNEELSMAKKEGNVKKVKEIEEKINNLSIENYKTLENFFERSKEKNIVGAFEGAGYKANGLYRPQLNCIMFSRGKIPYCKICEEAIKRKIKELTD